MLDSYLIDYCKSERNYCEGDVLKILSKIIETANSMELELAIDYAWTTFKVVFACSPIIAIVAILALLEKTRMRRLPRGKLNVQGADN